MQIFGLSRFLAARERTEQTWLEFLLRLSEIERYGSVFDHDRAGGLTQEFLQGTSKGICVHEGIVHIARAGVCDE